MGYNLTQINPAYELVSDIVVGTATTTVDFTGLSFDKTDDLMLVSDIVNTSGSNSDNFIYVNGNTTATNYYFQDMYADSTTVGSARYNKSTILYSVSGYKGFCIVPMKLTNNGYFVYQSKIINRYATSSPALESMYGTSTFTSTSITNLRIASSVASAIGAGSRFQLYKRVAPIIADIIVSSATTSVDFTGLNIDKGSEYMLVSDVVSSSVSYCSLFINNDTSINYATQRLVADGTSVIANRYDGATTLSELNGNKDFSISNIKLTNNGYYVRQTNVIKAYNTGSGLIMSNYYATSKFTATSITQLTITSNVASGIGVGSRFKLIKLR